MRPSREAIHMATALMWAQRSTCGQPNRKIGAVITTADMRSVMSIGYNGPATGLPNDYCKPDQLSYTKNILIGSKCDCLHAEDNAIAAVDSTVRSKTLFVTMSPCFICAQRIVQANIRRVVYLEEYRDSRGLDLLRRLNTPVERMSVEELTDVFKLTYQILSPIPSATSSPSTSKPRD